MIINLGLELSTWYLADKPEQRNLWPYDKGLCVNAELPIFFFYYRKHRLYYLTFSRHKNNVLMAMEASNKILKFLFLGSDLKVLVWRRWSDDHILIFFLNYTFNIYFIKKTYSRKFKCIHWSEDENRKWRLTKWNPFNTFSNVHHLYIFFVSWSLTVFEISQE